jgi:hypothetical protein
MSAEEFFARATSHKLKPHIINEDSGFVVVTYWWGRGNLNKNTQRPCPEDRDELMEEEGIKDYMLKDLKKRKPDATVSDLDPVEVLEELKAVAKIYKIKWKDPMKFEEMIGEWEDACRKHKCNFLAEEYPEFAVKGGYQHAINFKPYFIELALNACYPRGVLYIDGDMKVKLYPAIFDMKGVDYMARGWNVDSRPSVQRDPSVCFDPYILETSGGTMFFGNTYHGRELLKIWQKGTIANPGKADDRIISLEITKHSLLAKMSTVQLPIEYLWLDIDYDVLKKQYRSLTTTGSIAITHPECLTGEDRAASEGAASNRYPRSYDRYVTDLIKCRKEIVYEYIQFDEKSQMETFRSYFSWLKKHGIDLTVVPFDKKYGKHMATASKITSLMNQAELKVRENVVLVSPHAFDTISLHQVKSESEAIATILKYLVNGQQVVYAPTKSSKGLNIVVSKAVTEDLDFVARNVSKSKERAKADYYLELDKTYPMYFSPKSKTLKHLLLMSDSISKLESVFDESFIFLTRIHCGWV